jgi:hypothetical protein
VRASLWKEGNQKSMVPHPLLERFIRLIGSKSFIMFYLLLLLWKLYGKEMILGGSLGMLLQKIITIEKRFTFLYGLPLMSP